MLRTLFCSRSFLCASIGGTANFFGASSSSISLDLGDSSFLLDDAATHFTTLSLDEAVRAAAAIQAGLLLKAPLLFFDVNDD